MLAWLRVLVLVLLLVLMGDGHCCCAGLASRAGLASHARLGTYARLTACARRSESITAAVHTGLVLLLVKYGYLRD